MSSQLLIVREIFTHCQLDHVTGAIQGAVRLARIQNDTVNLPYFLMELGLAAGEARRSFRVTFPHLSEKECQDAFENAVERYMNVHEISEQNQQLLGVGKAFKVFSTGASTIDSDLDEARKLANEIKVSEITSIRQSGASPFWTLRQQANAKLALIKRIRSLMIANSFEYASQVEKSIHTAESASLFGEALWQDILVFLRMISSDAENQLINTFELFSSPDKEKRSHALTSMRRLIVTLSDELSPPKNEPGLEKEKYLNRLCKFVEDCIGRIGQAEVDSKEMEARLRHLNDRASKGVHAEISVFEARQCLLSLQLYLSALNYICSTGKTPSQRA